MEDFCSIQPDAANKMDSTWPRLYQILLDRLRKAKVSDKHLAKMVKILDDDTENPKTAGI